ncbi:hypothetical protein E2C01_012906 [Portunus trituberculatus]|uniref:Uncharacterized protein n=1 Tax=Portunus trituberculatus TaxID=210409 RepID=A0A5B7DFI9_PORTR|nr:hypothetical protein [Portunus trituberculatus]
MVPSLRDLTYGDRSKILKLPTLQQKRERGDLIAIAIYRADTVDKEDLLVWDSRNTRGYSMKLKRLRVEETLRNIVFHTEA